ncbi:MULTISPECIES: type II 3-dehydroquinate dehydratase [Streptomyces]|uniref:3-dehydroquinate dehydratase n=1 Tax=Streptomyces mordarskii TaxID=1226758 RepID=A0ABN1CCH4_9ACTN|nr:type II 3-dehydroquinate dehydratase [Streptomyces sp. WAC05858]RSS47393.1 type II 3-dehydroquinate dehydratase [Streptomyces sp. WAC05858]
MAEPLLNGPNLARPGRRRPEIYGTTTLAGIEEMAVKAVPGHTVRAVRDACEGPLVRAAGDRAGAIVDPGAPMMAGRSLRDALESFPAPWIEVHLSNVGAREDFRHHSALSPPASGVIAGLGAAEYRVAAPAPLAKIEG